jgi:tetratricopeptide (TPR) repeat protein
MLRRSLTIILIIFNCGRLFSSSSADSLLAFADKQYLAGNYESAVKEYLRISYFHNFSDPTIQIRLANSYYRIGDWATARQYYDQVFRLTGSDSILIQSKLSKISSLISETKYKLALIDLFNINDSIYQKHYFEIDLLFGICYFGLEDFEKSNSYFKHSVGANLEAQAKIDSIFHSKKAMYRPNPTTAYILSILVPGLGQIYSGDWSDGLNSFFLTESLLILGVFVAYNYTVLDAIVSIVPWFQRYFLGGLNNTSELVLERRKKNRSEAYREVLDILSDHRQKMLNGKPNSKG